MAYPAWLRVGTYAAGTNVTSVTVTWPSVAANDIAFLLVAQDGSGSVAPTISTPSGWTLAAEAGSDVDYTSSLFWKRCTGSETGTFTVSSSAAGGTGRHFAAIIHVFNGVTTTGTPFEGLTTQFSNAAVTTLNNSNLTTSGRDRLGVNLYAIGDNMASTPPSGWTERHDEGNATGNDGELVAEDQQIANPTTISASSRTIGTAAPYAAYTFALKSTIISLQVALLEEERFFGLARARVAGGNFPNLALRDNGTGTFDLELSPAAISIAPTGFGEEGLGAPSVNPVIDVFPVSVPSEEAAPASRLSIVLAASTLGSDEAFGTSVIESASAINLVPATLYSEEQVPSPLVPFTLSASAVSSEEKIPVSAFTFNVLPSSAASDQALGTPNVAHVARPSGIAEEGYSSPLVLVVGGPLVIKLINPGSGLTIKLAALPTVSTLYVASGNHGETFGEAEVVWFAGEALGLTALQFSGA